MTNAIEDINQDVVHPAAHNGNDEHACSRGLN